MLITLGIIGVVAALTMPSLIENHQKKEIVTQLKKVYTTLSQVQQMVNNENGFSNWDTYSDESIANTEEAFYKYLKPYLKVTEICKPGEACFRAKYKSLDGSEVNNNNANMLIQANLQNGTLFYYRYLPSGYFNIIADVNGYKKPNTYGKDIFEFDLQRTGISAAACNNCTRDEAINNALYGCRRGASGSACFQLILIDGWEIKDDYPW